MIRHQNCKRVIKKGKEFYTSHISSNLSINCSHNNIQMIQQMHFEQLKEAANNYQIQKAA